MEFDPYRQWLQIPADRLPPSPWALLGLAEGETDLDRIHRSAAERYEHVRKYILGPQGDQAQRLLTELSRAVTQLTQRQEPAIAPQMPVPRASSPARGAVQSGEQGEEIVALVPAKAIFEVAPEKSWPASFRDWLSNDREPADLYQLLGRLRFDPDREGLLADLRAAYRMLGPYENHPDQRRSERASQLRRLLSYAEEVLTAPQRLDDYRQSLLDTLSDAREKANARPSERWGTDQLLRWLEREQWVHPYALAAIARELNQRT